MAVVGSTILIDLHLTEETDIDTVRSAVRRNGTHVSTDLAGRVERTIQEEMTDALESRDVGDYTVSVDVDLVTGRVPGAPRERITVTLDFEGENGVVAAIDDAVGAPDRAQLADALEETTLDFLQQHDLRDDVEVTVSVTPIQFR
jgi:hypothetical protein